MSYGNPPPRLFAPDTQTTVFINGEQILSLEAVNIDTG